jgi:hypothetical protein
MSNRRVIVKFSFIAAMFVLVSCHNDVPGLPSPDEVQKYKSCKYKIKGEEVCKSTYEIDEDDCTNPVVGGTLFCDFKCTEPCPE